ncbi:MAG: hypothetical protein VX519_00615 [Myxococcota bacterium]|nr:hypothetical protein [Myxococcota bacterium]
MLLWLLACQGPGTSTSADPSPGASSLVPTPPISSVSYALSWSWEGLEPPQEQSPLIIETNLGYQVRVDAGELMNHTIQLVPCAPETGTLPLGWIPRLWGRTAWASDGTEADPSALPDHVPESFESLEDLELGRVETEDTVYCQLHYLVAPIAFGGRSLSISGEVTTADGISIPLEANTATAWGELYPLTPLVNETTSRPTNLHVGVQRSVATLFDNIDFSTNTDTEEQSQAFLRNLMDHTVLSLEVSPD